MEDIAHRGGGGGGGSDNTSQYTPLCTITQGGHHSEKRFRPVGFKAVCGEGRPE